MNKFLSLLDDELRRSKGFYLTLVCSVFIAEALLVGLKFYSYLSKYNLNKLDMIGSLEDVFNHNPYFVLIIGGAAFILILYSLFSWFREWQLQGKFIYRLLTIPGPRMPVYLAKLASILILMMGLLLLQVFIFVLTNFVGQFMPHLYDVIPWQFALTYRMPVYSHLMPSSPFTAFLIYGLGINFLIVAYNGCIILFSYRSYGIIRSIFRTIFYGLFSVMAFLIIYIWIFKLSLTSSETDLAIICLYLTHAGLQLLFSHYLMNRYISI